MYNKNDIIEVNIIDISTEGEGIGKTDAFTWFIKDTIKGDYVKASVMKVKKNYGYARLVQVIRKSEDRVKESCLVARACGGCSIQNMDYTAQLKFKADKVLNNLMRIGGFESPSEGGYEFFDTIGMEDPWRYRNKAIVPFSLDKNNKPIYGFFARHSHDIIKCEDCLIGHKDNQYILEVIKRFYSKPIRNVLIKRGYTTGQTMVCIIASADKIKDEDRIVKCLSKDLGVDTVILNINKDDTNVVLGNKERILYGSGYIEDYIGKLKFRISSRSFFQVNPIQVEKLYGKAVEFADLSGKEVVWDLYCGIGTITLSLAENAKHVYGVEIVDAAIEDAKQNAMLNNITNATFFVGKAEEVLPREQSILESSGQAGAYPDVIVVDPPRKGCDTVCLDTMLKMRPEKIVYVSCDSATLARDLKILCDGGYTLKKVQPVDMFPHSVHVECVVLLSKHS